MATNQCVMPMNIRESNFNFTANRRLVMVNTLYLNECIQRYARPPLCNMCHYPGDYPLRTNKQTKNIELPQSMWQNEYQLSFSKPKPIINLAPNGKQFCAMCTLQLYNVCVLWRRRWIAPPLDFIWFSVNN